MGDGPQRREGRGERRVTRGDKQEEREGRHEGVGDRRERGEGIFRDWMQKERGARGGQTVSRMNLKTSERLEALEVVLATDPRSTLDNESLEETQYGRGATEERGADGERGQWREERGER